VAFVDVDAAPGADPREARALVWSLRLLGGVSAVYLFALVVAPVVARREPAVHKELVRRLAWEHGYDSLSFFAKADDKLHYLHREGSDAAFVGYRVAGRVAVVAGDPVGPDAAATAAIGQFAAWCATNDWVPVFYEASDRYLDAYRSAGLRHFKVGEEAVIPLASFSLAGGKLAKVRQFINKVERENPDLTVSEYRRDPPDPAIDAQLEDISEEWLAGKSGGELGFNLGVFSLDDLADRRTVVASTPDGRVWAFLTWLTYRGGRALLLDAMRRRDDAPAGVMELLIARSALRFKDEGLEAISLATAPLASADDTGAATPYDKGVRLVFDHFSGFYGYRSLFQFKKKFNPAWEGRYLVFPRPDLLPRVVWALIRVHTTGSVLDWLKR
jgi:phosphatidylglycerol lysyltransferase